MKLLYYSSSRRQLNSDAKSSVYESLVSKERDNQPKELLNWRQQRKGIVNTECVTTGWM